MYKKTQGEDSLQTAMAYSKLGNILLIMGTYLEANTYFTRCLNTRKNGLGSDDILLVHFETWTNPLHLIVSTANFF